MCSLKEIPFQQVSTNTHFQYVNNNLERLNLGAAMWSEAAKKMFSKKIEKQVSQKEALKC